MSRATMTVDVFNYPPGKNLIPVVKRENSRALSAGCFRAERLCSRSVRVHSESGETRKDWVE